MAFESLSDRLSGIFKSWRGQSKLTEANIDEMLKEVRIALLEADVNFKVVKEFTSNLKEKAIGQEVFKNLNPSQMLVKIAHEEMTILLGSTETEINYQKNGLTIIMLVGLQGSGKTTSAAKLAYLLKKKLKKKVLLAACDIYRPAAIEQLSQLAKQIGVDIVDMGTKVDPVKIAQTAKKKAIDERYDVLLIDTAGRLEIDEKMMDELNDIYTSLGVHEALLLVDSMAGQNAVNVATAFNEKLKITGIILSKLDGDARGGAALSIKHLTGIPIKFAGIGEKVGDLDIFYPERMADRILGMGDILTLVEKAQEELDEKEMKKSANKMMDGKFDLEDMLKQMKQVQKLGSLGGIMKLIPGMPKITPEQQQKAEIEMKNFETIINSMTPQERRQPEILKFSRKTRISHGSGKSLADINKVLKKYEQSKEMAKKLQQYKKTGKMPPGGFPGAGMGF